MTNPYDRFPLDHEGGEHTSKNGGYPPGLSDATEPKLANQFADISVDLLEPTMNDSFLNRLAKRFSKTEDAPAARLADWIVEAEGDVESFDEADIPAPAPAAPAAPAVTDGPQAAPIGPGSSSPDNWQTSLQTGLNEHQIREKAVRLTDLVEDYQNMYLELRDCWEPLIANGGKHLEMQLPIIVKNLSREKLTKLAEIFTTLANHAMIV